MKLLRFEYTQKYLTWDFETCNLCLSEGDVEFQAPWQLGWLLSTGNKITQTNEDWIWWSDLIDKMNKWGKEARQFTHFEDEEYIKRAQPAEPIFDNFIKSLYNPDVINITANGYNFDHYILGIYAKLLNRKVEWDFLTRAVDIQCVQKAKVLGIDFPQIGTLEWAAFMLKMSSVKEKGLKTSLTFLCKEYSISYNSSEHHKSASYDGSITLAIFLEQIKTLKLGI